jgi:hypothetical protein
VSTVEVVGTTGSKVLDDAVTQALGRWRLKPHTLKAFYVPVMFFFDDALEKPFGEALNYAVHAPFPTAPFQARSDIRSKIRGWYQLFIDKRTGLVTDVKVVVPSHSDVLDQTARKTFLQWRFTPNTITTITLPVEMYPLWHM